MNEYGIESAEEMRKLSEESARQHGGELVLAEIAALVREYAQLGLTSMRITDYGKVYPHEERIPHFKSGAEWALAGLRLRGYEVHVGRDRTSQVVKEALITW